MTLIKKYILLMISILFMAATCSCSQNKSDNKALEVVLPKYPAVSILRNEESNIDVFKEKELSLINIDKLKGISDIKYNNENKIYVFKERVSKGIKFNKNIIKIINLNGEKNLKDFYTAEDIKLSPNGYYLAYRSFKEDSLDSAEGLKIYNIKENKPVVIENQTLVSGNLYEWINEDEILYYGVSEDKGASIFKYNIKKQEEMVYTPWINGYCTFFICFEDNVLMLVNNGESSNLVIYNKIDNSLKELDINFEVIYNSIYNKKEKEIFMIASENQEEVSLYKLSLGDLSLNKLNYDFPKFVDPNGGLALDNRGLVYYVGYSDDTKLKNDVFLYDDDENSNTLISKESSHYKIISED